MCIPRTLQCNKLYKSSHRRIAGTVDGDSVVPIFTPLQGEQVKRPSKQRVAAIVGGIGAAVLVLITLVLVYICLMRVKRYIRRTSETASSVPSPPIELERRGNTSPYAGALSPYDTQELRQLMMSELENATLNFSQSNIIGEGGFGLVYKGLLQDGSMVAITRSLHTQTLNFVGKVKQIACVHHQHLVKLIAYCEDSNQQLLVYDYLPNGNVGKHLYDSEGRLPIGKLNMRQRLLIALGAAKGLEHLHSLVPPLPHMHFRTNNVLVDETFTAKVSDYGLSNLVNHSNRASSSSTIDCFRDPELDLSKKFPERSDVYSFGVFLLEMISGRAAHCRYANYENLVLQAKESRFEYFVDKTLGDDHTKLGAAKEMMELALACVDTSRRRPAIRSVVEELERIEGGEIGRLHSGFGEEIDGVTLGSELFK